MEQSPKVSINDFSFLDRDEFRAKYAAGEKHSRVRFFIGGIRCARCVHKLESLPLQVKGMRRLDVELGTNLAHVEIDPDVLTLSQAAESIAALGFDPIPISVNESAVEAERRESRSEIIRLAVAGACAGNIMTFAFANYLGAAGDLAIVFKWLSFALYIPVVTYVTLPFYKGAWHGLRRRQLSIDIPMAIASFAGFLFSTVELLRGRDDIYFDSLAGFLFLILASRFVQKRLQRSFLRGQDLAEGLNFEKVRLVTSQGWEWRPLDQVRRDDRILLHAPETLPAEAELLSARAHFSLAWLSGESQPKTFLRGAVIPAGSRLISGQAQLAVHRTLGETTFGNILAEVQKFSLSRNRIANRADRWGQILLITVFSIAAIFLAAYWSVSPEAAVQRALALIILACPCAMAFGTPLALASALKRARAHGLIVRDANVFEAVGGIKNIFFDKTGTLTESEVSLVSDGQKIASVYQKIILALENESLHPIAFAFRRAFLNVEGLPPVEGFKEIAGSGVSGYVFGRYYELKRDTSEQTSLTCSLFEDDKLLFTFAFEARLKPDCLTVLNTLRSHGLNVRLLSGDRAQSVLETARFLDFKSEDVYSGASPEQKAEIVSREPASMMIGDGINDSLALMRAEVGVAVSGGVGAALKSAQVYVTEDSLGGILALFETSRFAMNSIQRNLYISLIYNTAAGAAALLGFVNPMVAALLMPVSSGFILISTWLKSDQ